MRVDRSRLEDEVKEGFADVPHPGANGIVDSDDWESLNLQNTFAALDWKTLPSEVIAHNFDQLPLFSPVAFRFFLPAYLLFSLKAEDVNDPVCQHTIYTLTPSKVDDNTRQFYLERLKLFTPQQIEVVHSFLNYFEQHPEAYDYYVYIGRGRKRLREILESK